MPGLITRPAPWRHRLSDHVTAIAWSHDGELVAAGSLGGDALIVGAGDGTVVDTPAEHPMGVLSLAWSIDRTLAIGGQDGDVTIVTPGGGDEVRFPLGSWINVLGWSPVADVLAVGAGKRLVVIASGEVVGDVELPSTVSSIVWSVDGTRLGAGCYGGVHWFAGPDWSAHRVFDWKGSVLSLAMAPSGKWLAGGSQDATIQIWRLWSAEHLEMRGYPAKIQLLAWDAESHWLANSCLESITVWDCSGKGPKGRRPDQLEGHSTRVTGLGFSGEGLLASGSTDGRVVLWANRRKWREVGCASVEGGVSTLAWAPPGPLLAVGSEQGDLEVMWATDLLEPQ